MSSKMSPGGTQLPAPGSGLGKPLPSAAPRSSRALSTPSATAVKAPMVLSRSTQPRVPMEPEKLQVVAGHHAPTNVATIQMPSNLPGLDVSFAYQQLETQSTSTSSHGPAGATDLQPAPARSPAPGSGASDACRTFAASGAAPQIQEVASDVTATHLVADLSAELDALLLEVEQDLLPFLGTRPQQPSAPEHHQQALSAGGASAATRVDSSGLPATFSAAARSSSGNNSSSNSGNNSSSSSSITSRKATASVKGLSLLQLTQRPAGGRHAGRNGSGSKAAAAATPSDTAEAEVEAVTALVARENEAGAGAIVAATSAGDRAQRRRQIWQKSTPVEPSPVAKNAYFKAKGGNSVAKFMGGFQRDSLLNQAEEHQLASAAQDFMDLQELRRIMNSFLRRPPSLEELAEATRCDVDKLRLRLEAGNRARAILAQKNYRLVVACAKWACGPTGGASSRRSGAGGGSSGLDGSHELAFEDALTAGMEGLMRGIQKFKPDSGYRLSTYCTWWIRMSIRKALARQSTALQLPLSVVQSVEALNSARQRLSKPGASPPTDEAVAAELGWSLTRLRNADAARRLATSVKSFEAPIAASAGGGGGSDDDGGSLDDRFVQMLEDDDFAEGAGSALALDSEEHFMRSTDLAAAVQGVLAEIDSNLDASDSALIRSEFGLDELPPPLIRGVEDLGPEQPGSSAVAAGGDGGISNGKRRRRKAASGAAAAPVGTVSSAQAAAVAAVARGRTGVPAAADGRPQPRASGAERLQLTGPEKKPPRQGTRVRHAIKRLQHALGEKQALAEAQAETEAEAGVRKPRGRGRPTAAKSAGDEVADGLEAEGSSGALDARVELLLSAGRNARLGAGLQGRSSGGYTKKSSF